MAAQGVMQLDDLRWRVDPNSVDWTFQLDTARIETLGGQVVQIVGSTLSDLVITGDFGEDHKGKKVSWQLAVAFHDRIQAMMDKQTQPAKSIAQSQATKAQPGSVLTDAAPIHKPFPLTYHDGVHNWSFQVLIKAIEDSDGSQLVHRTGRFSYHYKLTLFIVKADSRLVRTIASDYFLTRIAQGLNWRQSKFNGPPDAQSAQDFIVANGGSIPAFLDNVLEGGSPIVSPSPPSGPGQHQQVG